MDLYQCHLSSSWRSDVENRTILRQCEDSVSLQDMFVKSFKTRGSEFYKYDSIMTEAVVIKDVPIVTATTTLSKKKLYDIIKRVVNENDLMRDLNRKNEINYLVNVVIREIKGKASPKTIREILIKIIKRKIKHLKRNNIEITLAQACSFNKFCLDCRYVGINNKSGGYKITLCEKHKKDSKSIVKMLDANEKWYCPTCKTLGHHYNGCWNCPDQDCRVVGFFTG